MKVENREPKFRWVKATKMKTYTVQVKWKGRSMREEYECSERQIELIIKEFKAMKDKPWSVKIL